MKKIRKSILILAALTTAALCSASLVACGGNGGGKTEKSELMGSFEASQSKDVTLTNDAALLSDTDDGVPYIYTSDVYPLNTVERVGVRYTSYQKLRLKRDFTYEYTLEIMVRMVSSQANVDLAKLEASVKGTFEYKQNSGENYSVTISDPVSGDEKRYGSYIIGENNIHSWKLSSSPNYRYTVSGTEIDDDETFEFDRYISGKIVGVEKIGTERVLYSDMFFDDFMNDIAPYCSYDSSAIVRPDPDVPDDPDDPNKPDKPNVGPSDPVNPDAPVIPTKPIGPAAVEKSDATELTKKPYADGAAQVSIGMADGGLNVKLYGPTTAASAQFGSESTTEFAVVGDSRVFTLPLDYEDIKTTAAVNIGGTTFDFNAYEYLCGMTSANGTPEELAAETLAANILNVAAKKGCDVTLDARQASRIFNAKENIYLDVQWGERDNLTLYNGAKDDQKKDGFKQWVGVPELSWNGGGATLKYVFETESAFTALNAKVSVGGGDPYATDVLSLGDGRYAVNVGINSPLRFADEVAVTVYEGDTPISQTAIYSVNRAAGHVGQFGAADIKQLTAAMWSLGKASAWYADSDLVDYTLSVGDGVSYIFNYGEYGAYSVSTDLTVDANRFGTNLYTEGAVVNGGNSSMTDEDKGLDISYDSVGKVFDVSLANADIDVINAKNAGGHTLNVSLAGDSSLNGAIRFGSQYWESWGSYWLYDPSAALYADCDVVIKGESGAKLTVNGSVYTTGRLTVDGVALEVIVKDAAQGYAVTCGGFDIVNGGSVKITYAGYGESRKTAVSAGGDVDIDGTLEIIGFADGIYLSSEDAAQTLTVNGGDVSVVVGGYGITSRDVTVDAAARDGEPAEPEKIHVNKQLYFNGGVTSIFTGNGTVNGAGIAFGDVTVGDATLNIIADSGYCVEAKNPVTFKTTSGDYRKGKVVLVNNFYNPWYDVNYAIKVKTLDLNGGSVYAYAMSRSGVIYTETGAEITLSNCDLTVRNGQDITDTANRGYGINLCGRKETVTVATSAKLIFENCAVAVQCWIFNPQEGDVPVIANRGVIVLDTFVARVDWPWLWSMTYSFEGEGGMVRVTNQVD